MVMKLIRRVQREKKLNHGLTLKEFKKQMPEEHRVLLGGIARGAFNDVIPRFHIVHGARIEPKIFTFTGRVGQVGDTIELTDGGRRFLVSHNKLVNYVAVAGWVRFTEQYTSAPRLHDKIENSKLKRGALRRWQTILRALQNGKCFY